MDSCCHLTSFLFPQFLTTLEGENWSLLQMMSSSSLKSTIWIGSIDPKATEGQILKLVQPYGQVLKFDFIYQTSTETNERIPRGYCFVTYDNYVSADAATRGLNGLKVLSKTLKAQISSSSSSSSSKKSLPISLSAGNVKKTDDLKSTKNNKIKALEAKLKALESCKKDEFKVVPSTSRSKHKPYDRNK